MKQIFLWIEKAFWMIMAVFTLMGAFGMRLKDGYIVYEDFNQLKR